MSSCQRFARHRPMMSPRPVASRKSSHHTKDVRFRTGSCKKGGEKQRLFLSSFSPLDPEARRLSYYSVNVPPNRPYACRSDAKSTILTAEVLPFTTKQPILKFAAVFCIIF
ncbi:MAG: hypothetical protein JW795_16830 [Chitinivibrionales bacterium]|nr:hypothetical protein [Chitinivibrionales bacterium]